MDVIGIIVNDLLWFIAGGIFVCVFAAGFAAGFCCNDRELKETVEEDEIIKRYLNEFYYFPGYGLGKKIAIWINRYENDL